MKPLPVITLTLEDWEAWHWSEADWNDLARLELMDAYEAADDRSYLLMCAWIRGWPIDLGGIDEEGECLFWNHVMWRSAHL